MIEIAWITGVAVITFALGITSRSTGAAALRGFLFGFLAPLFSLALLNISVNFGAGDSFWWFVTAIPVILLYSLVPAVVCALIGLISCGVKHLHQRRKEIEHLEG